MKKVVILACERIRNQNLCVACNKCFVAANKLEGEFARHKDEVAILGIMNCGGCPGNLVVPSLVLLSMQLASFNEKIDAVHIGTCIMRFCPNKDNIIKIIKEKAGVEVIEGTHTYGKGTIF
ncbi:MAG: CGGC domain-containing protein [Thermodesulfobacteria bacterium]|nr:CGGC domain-containing protein [Thermodesulfobacteriota bacterium]